MHQLYISFKHQAGRGNLEGLLLGETKTDYFDWAISSMNMIIGYLLVLNHSHLSKKLAYLTIKNDTYLEEE
ncbi:MAG TPA: hypothetical protein P5235_04715 [Saprospiraceae bacterium]|nr:hypothetical protein [Saprospiraceae bacterium]